jgi:nitronate monooxygenase
VNNRAGGHAGTQGIEELYRSMHDLKVPIICAGGVSDKKTFQQAIDLGYAGVQMGTRFIATQECNAHVDYKNAIIKATSSDIVLTDKISGVPVSIIKTPYIEKIGIKANPVARFLLQHQSTKHWMRMFYTLQSIWKLKRASLEGGGYKDYWQAGKSVDGCDSILSVKEVIEQMTMDLGIQLQPKNDEGKQWQVSL